jgi:hypothetical protein
MKTGLWIGLAIVTVVVLVFVALTVGWAVWGRQLWAAGPFAATGGCGGSAVGPRAGMMGRGYGPGMMGGGPAPIAPGGCGAIGQGWGTAPVSGTLTIEEAREAVERYAAGLGTSGLEVKEVMEFEYNFYAIVQESDTGVGALEVLVDKATGGVYPEMGPNMMWNGRYGMHNRMMGGVGETNTISADEAKEIAQRWLDANRPGVTVEDVDPFYGYYTVHTLKDGQIEGMLSVHGSTGQVWYHTWHGRFIQMLEEEGE